jgi:hypothetical protein
LLTLIQVSHDKTEASRPFIWCKRGLVHVYTKHNEIRMTRRKLEWIREGERKLKPERVRRNSASTDMALICYFVVMESRIGETLLIPTLNKGPAKQVEMRKYKVFWALQRCLWCISTTLFSTGVPVIAEYRGNVQCSIYLHHIPRWYTSSNLAPARAIWHLWYLPKCVVLKVGSIILYFHIC